MKNTKLTNINCNLCGEDDYAVHLAGNGVGVDASFSTTSQVYSGDRIVKCSNCGLVYVNPRLSTKSVIDAYSKGEKTYLVDADARSESFCKSLKTVCKYKKNGKLLDVGTAAGLFLKVALDSGYDVYGVEPNEDLAKWGRENVTKNICSEPIEKVKHKASFFDVITFWDVLEHLTDPMAALIKSNKLLKKGGIVVINYPDISSLSARLFGKNWWFITSGHLYYFDPTTITKMLEKSGFEVIESRRHIQTLSLSYLFTRLGRYNEKLGERLSMISKKLGLGKINIPYYAGQKMVVARKV